MSQDYHRAYLVATWLSQGCRANLVVTGLSQGAYQVVTGLSKCCQRVVTMMSGLSGCHRFVTGLLSGLSVCHRVVIGLLQGCHRSVTVLTGVVTGLSQGCVGCCHVVTGLSQGGVGRCEVVTGLRADVKCHRVACYVLSQGKLSHGVVRLSQGCVQAVRVSQGCSGLWWHCRRNGVRTTVRIQPFERNYERIQRSPFSAKTHYWLFEHKTHVPTAGYVSEHTTFSLGINGNP